MTAHSAVAAVRSALAALAVAAAFALVPEARASATTVDYSDLWWNPSESGWGVQLVHRGSAIFATMFVYDNAGKPTWLMATMRASGSAWTGELYVTSGPWLGAPSFDPNAVTRRLAGTMSWTSADGASGTIAYTLDGTTVSKNVVRQPIDTDNVAGRYFGAISGRNSCTGLNEGFVTLTVTQVNRNVSINWINETSRDSCSFSGTLTQDGQFAKIVGTFQCGPVHDDGVFTFREVRVTPQSITGRFDSLDEDTNCSASGYIAAARRQ